MHDYDGYLNVDCFAYMQTNRKTATISDVCNVIG